MEAWINSPHTFGVGCGQLHDVAYLLPGKMPLVPIEDEALEVPENFVENRTMIP
jgi:hypothetical protein